MLTDTPVSEPGGIAHSLPKDGPRPYSACLRISVLTKEKTSSSNYTFRKGYARPIQTRATDPGDRRVRAAAIPEQRRKWKTMKGKREGKEKIVERKSSPAARHPLHDVVTIIIRMPAPRRLRPLRLRRLKTDPRCQLQLTDQRIHGV